MALLCARTAGAYSLLPLATEDPVPVPSGLTQLSLGAAYSYGGVFPFFTEASTIESQNLVQVPQLALRIGAGGWVEILASYELLYIDQHTTDAGTISEYGSGDARIFTKARLFEEGQIMPALALGFGTKLPNANRSNRLGTDEIDFGGEVLASKHLGPVNLIANLGLLLMDVPAPLEPGQEFTGGQDDLFSYAVAAVSPPLGGADPEGIQITLMGEFVGLAGSRFGNDRASFQLGTQAKRGAGTVYLGVSAGLLSDSADVGAAIGFIYSFDVAKLFAGHQDPSE
jgi:hypothetical protein